MLTDGIGHAIGVPDEGLSRIPYSDARDTPMGTTSPTVLLMFSIDQLRIFTEPQQGATYDDLLAVAAARRAARLRRLLPQRPLPGDGRAREPAACRDRPTRGSTLAGLARDTSTIRLGTLVTSATFRLPGPLAITVARSTRCRAAASSSASAPAGTSSEHTAYGIPFPPLGERFDRLEEQLAIITGLWSTPVGETFSFDGAALPASPTSPALPKPVQAGGVADHHRRWRRRSARRRSPPASRAEFNMPFVAPRAVRRAARTGRRRLRRPSTATRPPSCTPRRRSCASAPTRPSSSGGPRRSAANPTSCARTASPARLTRSRAALRALVRRRRRAALPPGPRPVRPRPPRRHRRARELISPGSAAPDRGPGPPGRTSPHARRRRRRRVPGRGRARRRRPGR